MKHLNKLFIILFFCVGCQAQEEIIYIPKLDYFIKMKVSQYNVTVLFSDDINSFSDNPVHKIDHMIIPKKSSLPAPYYTFFFSKNQLDTIWFKHGTTVNSVYIPMSEVPRLQSKNVNSFVQKLFPLQEYYSLQVYWDGRKYSLHLQNNEGEIIRVD